jgi:hypothetical protein
MLIIISGSDATGWTATVDGVTLIAPTGPMLHAEVLRRFDEATLRAGSFVLNGHEVDFDDLALYLDTALVRSLLEAAADRRAGTPADEVRRQIDERDREERDELKRRERERGE